MPISKLFILLTVFIFAACATKQRLGFEELSSFQISCAKRHEQYEFLESQKYSSDERIMLYLQTLYPPTFFTLMRDGSFKDNYDGIDGKHEAMIKMAQRQLKQHCAAQNLLNR
jgi:hypothetical protein